MTKATYDIVANFDFIPHADYVLEAGFDDVEAGSVFQNVGVVIPAYQTDAFEYILNNDNNVIRFTKVD
jgi:hypothetical protein